MAQRYFKSFSLNKKEGEDLEELLLRNKIKLVEVIRLGINSMRKRIQRKSLDTKV